MADISFFKERNMKRMEMNEVCAALEYDCVPKNSKVIRYGEEGDSFYIILKGDVSVWVPVPLKEITSPLQRFRESMRIKKAEKIGNDFRFPKRILHDSLFGNGDEDDDIYFNASSNKTSDKPHKTSEKPRLSTNM